MSFPPQPRVFVVFRSVVFDLDSPVFCSLSRWQPRQAHLDLDGRQADPEFVRRGLCAAIRPGMSWMFVFRRRPRLVVLVVLVCLVHGFVVGFIPELVVGRRDQPRQGAVEGGKGCGGYLVEGQGIGRVVVVIAQVGLKSKRLGVCEGSIDKKLVIGALTAVGGRHGGTGDDRDLQLLKEERENAKISKPGIPS